MAGTVLKQQLSTIKNMNIIGTVTIKSAINLDDLDKQVAPLVATIKK